jgi:hypothetical protein
VRALTNREACLCFPPRTFALRSLLRTLLVASGVAALLVGVDVYIASLTNRLAPVETLTICQATGLDGHPYRPLDVGIAPDGSIRNIDQSRDIVPPYSYGGRGHAGDNWTTDGRAVWYTGCQAGSSLSSAPPPAVGATVSASPSGPGSLGRSTDGRPLADPQGEMSRVIGAYLMVVGFLAIGVGRWAVL